MVIATEFGRVGARNSFCKNSKQDSRWTKKQGSVWKNTRGGRASHYNPVILSKVLIYCYMTGIYSSRQMARQCRQNVSWCSWQDFTNPISEQYIQATKSSDDFSCVAWKSLSWMGIIDNRLWYQADC